jgi:CRISPR-associated protein Csc1
MTHIYRCVLELHDSLYFATREIGRLYETEPVIHNYALCYALGLVDSDRYGTKVSTEHEYRYFCPEQVPLYAEHLSELNEVGIYVTPARSLQHASVLHTWKYANNNYHVEMEKMQKNIPTFGRAKEIAPESSFEFFILSRNPLPQPAKWIRLGKWMSKAELTVTQLDQITQGSGDFIFPYHLNPLDVMFTHQVLSYDTISMLPVSLISNVRINGHFYNVAGLKIPARMEYRFKV